MRIYMDLTGPYQFVFTQRNNHRSIVDTFSFTALYRGSGLLAARAPAPLGAPPAAPGTPQGRERCRGVTPLAAAGSPGQMRSARRAAGSSRTRTRKLQPSVWTWASAARASRSTTTTCTHARRPAGLAEGLCREPPTGTTSAGRRRRCRCWPRLRRRQQQRRRLTHPSQRASAAPHGAARPLPQPAASPRRRLGAA